MKKIIKLPTSLLLTLLIAFISCGLMAWVDLVYMPGYLTKSIIKLICFLAIPLGYGLYTAPRQCLEILKPNKKNLLMAILLGVIVYVLLLGGYYIFSFFIDFSQITTSLERSIGVNKENFVFVALYISFVNSFLEEYFFRGFLFIRIKKMGYRYFAYFISSILFALYHVGMMQNWFNIWFFLLLIFGLFISGIFFDALNEKKGTIYTSWAVHMFANFSINTIGFTLFGII